jgi:hypothetical protein
MRWGLQKTLYMAKSPAFIISMPQLGLCIAFSMPVSKRWIGRVPVVLPSVSIPAYGRTLVSLQSLSAWFQNGAAFPFTTMLGRSTGELRR